MADGSESPRPVAVKPIKSILKKTDDAAQQTPKNTTRLTWSQDRFAAVKIYNIGNDILQVRTAEITFLPVPKESSEVIPEPATSNSMENKPMIDNPAMLVQYLKRDFKDYTPPVDPKNPTNKEIMQARKFLVARKATSSLAYQWLDIFFAPQRTQTLIKK